MRVATARLCAVALRTQSILPLIVIHALMDFVAFLAFNGTDSRPLHPGSWRIQRDRRRSVLCISRSVLSRCEEYARLTLNPTRAMSVTKRLPGCSMSGRKSYF